MSAPGAPTRVRPPVVARAVLTRAARRLRVPDLVSDAEEHFERLASRDGRPAARRWYRRQARSALLEAIREVGGEWVEGVVRELRLGARRVARAPGLALSFATVVGVGMGAAAFMGQTRAAMLRPDLGLGRSVELVRWIDGGGAEVPGVPLTGREPWLAAAPAGAAALVTLRASSPVVETPNGHVRASAHEVPPGFVAAMGARAAFGDDLREPGDVLLSERFWRARLGADRSVLGSRIALDGQSARVVGVAPAGFDGPLCCAPPDLWTVTTPSDTPAYTVLAVVGAVDSEAVAALLTERALQESAGARARLVPAESAPYGGERGLVGRTLAALLGLAWLTLAGTLLSGANMVLADTLERGPELRLRRALGSDAPGIALRVVGETVWLASLAAGVAGATSWALVRAAPWFLPMVGGRSAVEVEWGGVAWASVAAAAALATVVCALPAMFVGLRLSRATAVQRGPARSGAAGFGLAAQVCLATGVLVLGTQFGRSVRVLDGDFVGFRHGDVRAYLLSALPGGEPGDPVAMHEELLEAPGVRGAALSRRLPLPGPRTDSVTLPDGRTVAAAAERVTPDFFATVGTRLVAGEAARGYDEAVVSADLAARVASSPLGALGEVLVLADSARVRVVGVVEQATWGTGAPRPTVYRGWSGSTTASATLLVDFSSPREATPAVLRAAARHRLTVQPFETLDALLVRSRILSVFLARLAAFFAALCAGVALAGVHAHFVRWVRARTRELGIRSALGAPRARLGGGLVRAGLALVVPGVFAGCALGWAGSGLTSALVVDAARTAPLTLLGAGAVVLALSLVALGWPARRAGAVDPVHLLRTD